jgi:hypothetical protein
MNFVIISYVGVAKILGSFPCVFFGRDAIAALGYFSLGSGEPDSDFIRKTHPILILAFSKAVGLGQDSFLERKV